jgi:hypothetical protein
MRMIGFVLSLNRLATIIGLSASCVCAFAQPTSAPLSLCQVVQHINKFAHKQLQIDADLHSAWPHGVFLEDERCPEKTLRLDYPSPVTDPRITELDRLILDRKLSIGIIASGRFSGVIERSRSSGHFLLSVRSVTALVPKAGGDGASESLPSVWQVEAGGPDADDRSSHVEGAGFRDPE